MLADGFVGEVGLIAPDQGAADADRQLQPVGGLGEQARIVEGGARLEDGDRAVRVSGKAFRDNRSSAAGADDQHIAVRDGCGQGGG